MSHNVFENYFVSPKDSKSWEKLQRLSTKPIDLTNDSNFDSKRFNEFQSQGANWKLLYHFERVDEETLDTLFELSKDLKLIEQMQDLRKGSRANVIKGISCENRSVVHSSLRSFLKKPKDQQDQYEVASANEFFKLENFLEMESVKKFDTLVQVGIGGSHLGPEALAISLEPFAKPGKKLHFISNVDPQEAHHVLSKVNLETTVFVCVSKSGSTLETKSNEQVVRKYLEDKGFDSQKHMVAITEKGSPLDNPQNYLEVFYIWDYIGGRFSATSMVGLVALGFYLGIEAVKCFLEGALKMDEVALNPNKSNLPLLGALFRLWNGNFLGASSVAVIAYSFLLRRFIAHLQQLEMESNGKQISRLGKKVDYSTGLSVWGEPGANSQHSFFQWLHQGTQVTPVEFIGVLNPQKNSCFETSAKMQKELLCSLFGQAMAFAKGQSNENPNKVFIGNRPSTTLLTKDLNPESVGSLLSYYENVTVFEGFLWNINSFDQEGVQLGKKLANELLNTSKESKSSYEVFLKKLTVL
jgi:glucose-6-phosphate isomerase